MTDLRDELITKLSEEQQRIAQTIPQSGLGLLEICRAMDTYWVQIKFGPQNIKNDYAPLSRLYEFGVNKALQLTMKGDTADPYFLLVSTNTALMGWANSFIQYCGKLSMLEHLLELQRVGLAELSRIGNDYRFEISVKNSGYENYEAQYAKWAVKKASSIQLAFWHSTKKERRKILKQMGPLVQMSHRDFMTYDTNPTIDEYFTRFGLTESGKMFGRDVFPRNATFGGLEFGVYCDAIAMMTGWGLKHLFFASQLIEKRSYMNISNLLTLVKPKSRILGYLQSALDIDESTAEQLVNTMTLSNSNLEIHTSVPGDFAAPSYITLGLDRLISPVWGNLAHPFQFLLEELKMKYPKDWFDNVNLREDVFRRDIYGLFPRPRYIPVDRPVIIKKEGKNLTDFDAVVFDTQTHKLAIFQLKFQDFFRHSLRQRSNRKADMLKVNNWIDKTADWITNNTMEEIVDKLQLPVPSIRKDGVRLFVLGRYAAHFSGSEKPDNRAAWGTWLQFQRIFEGIETEGDVIENLYNDLQNESPHLVEGQFHPEDTEIIIGTSKILLCGA